MVLCKLCRNITVPGLVNERPSSRVKDAREVGYNHHRSYDQLEASATTCQCCSLIIRTINKPADFEWKPNKPNPIRLVGSGRRGVSTLTAIVEGSKLRAFFDVIADPDSRAFVSGSVEGRLPASEANSTECFSLIADWLQDCEDNHPECTTNLSDSEYLPHLPHRILEVNSDGGSDTLRLADGAGCIENYATLSYCWGHTQTIQTTRSSLSTHKAKISFNALPMTLQDAITITRRLGLRYLWIDALCIVQDDKAEWEREAAKMGDIYQNSIVTIAATGASNCSEGCFLPRSPIPKDYVDLPFLPVPSCDKADGVFSILATQGSFSTSVLQSTWNTRGWILQERLLSRRLIHFAKGRMFWECATLSRCEDCKPVMMQTKRSLNEFLKGTALDWCQLVEDYTKRKLTNSEDKLIALEALAGRRRVLTGDEYHFGLWKSFLHANLLWYNTSTSPQLVPASLAPSWSWASVDGPVKWESWITDAVSAGTASASGRILTLTTSVKPIGRSRFNLQHDNLESKLTSDQAYDVHVMKLATAIVSDDLKHCGAEIGWAAFDDDGTLPFSSIHYFAARISDNKDAVNKRDTSNVLILRYIPDDEVYVRAGIGEIVVNGWFDSGVETIRII